MGKAFISTDLSTFKRREDKGKQEGMRKSP